MTTREIHFDRGRVRRNRKSPFCETQSVSVEAGDKLFHPNKPRVNKTRMHQLGPEIYYPRVWEKKKKIFSNELIACEGRKFGEKEQRRREIEGA